MSEVPVVSVSMITYNHEAYIAEAIESVLSQETVYAYELVIGEDCSTDRTREIIRDYQQRYPDVIRVITSKENVGAAANLRRVEVACRGKYIAYCEGDDYWHDPTKLQKQISYLENHPECGLVHSDVDYLYAATGRRIERMHAYAGHVHNDEGENLCWRILAGEYPSIVTCTACVRADPMKHLVAEDAYEFSEVFLMGDTQRWVEISRLARIKFMDVSLATHRLLMESASQSLSPERRLIFHQSGDSLKLYCLGKYSDCPAELEKRILRSYPYFLFLEAVTTKNHELSVSALKIMEERGIVPTLADRLRACASGGSLLSSLFSLAKEVKRRARVAKQVVRALGRRGGMDSISRCERSSTNNF